MNNDHNQAGRIAEIVCRCCLSRSIPYKSLFETEEKVEKTYGMLQRFGLKKAMLESKSHFLVRAFLHTESIFTVVAENIELVCRFQNGSVRRWYGTGAIKSYTPEYLADLGKALEEHGIGSYPITLVEYQVDITRIWDEISPYLET